jgi:hypothetical protein
VVSRRAVAVRGVGNAPPRARAHGGDRARGRRARRDQPRLRQPPGRSFALPRAPGRGAPHRARAPVPPQEAPRRAGLARLQHRHRRVPAGAAALSARAVRVWRRRRRRPDLRALLHPPRRRDLGPHARRRCWRRRRDPRWHRRQHRGPARLRHPPRRRARGRTRDWDQDDLLLEQLRAEVSNIEASRSWGTLAGRLRERILAAQQPRVHFTEILRAFRTSIVSRTRYLTRMRPSRRYGFGAMGSRYALRSRLLVAIDVSARRTTSRSFATPICVALRRRDRSESAEDAVAITPCSARISAPQFDHLVVRSRRECLARTSLPGRGGGFPRDPSVSEGGRGCRGGNRVG